MYRRLVLVASALAAVSAGCGGSDRPHARAAAPASRLDLGIVAVEARIGGDDVASSGIVVNDRQGLVVTTAHTVWGATSLKVATQLGLLHGRIVARAPCDDLAVVQIYPLIPGLVSPPAAPSSAPAPGQLLRTVGRRRASPEAGQFGLLSIPSRAGSASPAGDAAAALPRPASAVALDSPLVPEVSGGPVLDQAGRVTGMALPDATRSGLVFPWRSIRQRLNELRRGPRQLFVGWRDQYHCVSRLHAYERSLHPGFKPQDARLDAPVPATRVPGTEELNG
jgi:S1-C subfamily serine protease